MNYEKVSNPIYRFEFNSEEATTLSDIMNAVRSLNGANAFIPAEKDLAAAILNSFDDSDL